MNQHTYIETFSIALKIYKNYLCQALRQSAFQFKIKKYINYN